MEAADCAGEDGMCLLLLLVEAHCQFEVVLGEVMTLVVVSW